MNLKLVQYVITGALRDRLISTLLALLAVAISLSIFFGSSAIVEKGQFVVVFASGALRLVSVIGIVLFIVFFVRRSFETKDVEFVLSRPISRVSFIFSYAAAFSCIALFFGVATALSLLVFAPNLNYDGYFIWVVSILVEFLIIANVSMFFAMILSSAATASIAVLGFYVLSRMMGQILGIIQSTPLSSDNTITQIMESGMHMVSVLMPRLDLMGQTSWLIYGHEGSISIIYVILQGTIFILLVLLASIWDLIRKQF